MSIQKFVAKFLLNYSCYIHIYLYNKYVSINETKRIKPSKTNPIIIKIK